ncbi:MAG: hypothetical protein LUE27_08985 [Clostridia bacterium]|nr:hypothetical protein [Clostridia bacterium]
MENLINGLISTRETSSSGITPGREEIDRDLSREIGLTEAQEAKLNELRRANTGRPKGSGRHWNAKQPEMRATFVISDPSLIRKLKIIALRETRLYKSVVEEAFRAYIDKWEEENGLITL